MLRSLIIVTGALLCGSPHCLAQKAPDDKTPAVSGGRSEVDARNIERTRCLSAWDAGTHLTRQRWAEICQEQNRAAERAGRLR